MSLVEALDYRVRGEYMDPEREEKLEFSRALMEDILDSQLEPGEVEFEIDWGEK